jgi:hypothetical protein
MLHGAVFHKDNLCQNIMYFDPLFLSLGFTNAKKRTLFAESALFLLLFSLFRDEKISILNMWDAVFIHVSEDLLAEFRTCLLRSLLKEI